MVTLIKKIYSPALSLTLLFLVWNIPTISLGQTQTELYKNSVGKVTGLPIPRYVSMKGSEGFTRRGPHPDYSITWEFKQKGIPFRVIDEDGNYRRVETMNGIGGWIYYQNLSGVRTVIITQEASILSQPKIQAKTVAKAENMVIAELDRCTVTWCKIKVANLSGWVSKSFIWGVDLEEIFE